MSDRIPSNLENVKRNLEFEKGTATHQSRSRKRRHDVGESSQRASSVHNMEGNGNFYLN